MDMTNEDTIRAIENLRSFALKHNELPFFHLCTAALAGEEWAVERIDEVRDLISDREDEGTHSTYRATIEAIRATDTTRPDGSIARRMSAPR